MTELIGDAMLHRMRRHLHGQQFYLNVEMPASEHDLMLELVATRQTLTQLKAEIALCSATGAHIDMDRVRAIGGTSLVMMPQKRTRGRWADVRDDIRTLYTELVTASNVAMKQTHGAIMHASYVARCELADSLVPYEHELAGTLLIRYSVARHLLALDDALEFKEAHESNALRDKGHTVEVAFSSDEALATSNRKHEQRKTAQHKP